MIAIISLPKISWLAILPELVLFSTALTVLFVNSLFVRINEKIYFFMSLFGSLGAFVIEIILFFYVRQHHPYVTARSELAVDNFGTFLSFVVTLSVIVSICFALNYLNRREGSGPELYALMLTSAGGAVTMVAANDLIITFLGLEIMSIGLYVMASFDRSYNKSGEAGLKYLILGGLASAIFVYGIALEYGSTGSTNLAQIASYLTHNALKNNGLFLVAIVLVVSGLAFKVASAPFHVWTPDVYEGSPLPSATFMSAVAKVAGFGALLRILFSALYVYKVDWQPIIWLLAVLSLFIGALGGLRQTNFKRLMAYSAINNAGFILLGVYAGSSSGLSGSATYIASYAIIVLGSLGTVSVLSLGSSKYGSISDLKGLYRSQPVLSLLLTIFLLAQAGVPLTVGFVAKLSVLIAAFKDGGAFSYVLGSLAMVSAIIAGFYYLRVILTLFSTAEFLSVDELSLSEGSDFSSVSVNVQKETKISLNGYELAPLYLLGGFVILFGILPQLLTALSNASTLVF